MTLPLVGTIDVTVRGVADVVIHGDRYLDLVIDGDGGRQAIRVPLHAFSRYPRADDVLRLKVLLGQVDSVEFVDAAE